MKKDYIKALVLPIILLLILIIIAYTVSYFLYNSQGQVASKSLINIIFSGILALFSLFIYALSGYLTVKKYNGTVKNCIFIGGIIGIVQTILSIFNMFLMYSTISGYKNSISILFTSSTLKIFFIIGMLFGFIVAIAIAVGLSCLGGYIASKSKKK